MANQDSVGRERIGSDNDVIAENQFLLEYVHAVLASDSARDGLIFDENLSNEIFEIAGTLRQQAMLFAMASSAGATSSVFGPDTADIEFRAKSNWIIMRGNRYQVLEGEFYTYVLEPHDEVLKELYGVGAVGIAEGFQAVANAARSGFANAMSEVMNHLGEAQTFAASHGKPLEGVMDEWVGSHFKGTEQAIDDIFRGGIANVSRHTNLPPSLLADLAYKRGEETEFFAAGAFKGTPYRTLPSRKKPLIDINSEYYAVDPCSMRDAGYRAVLYNIIQRKPLYKKTFEDRQKTMSEAAFADILALQLPNAKIFKDFYYKDSNTRQWCENDTLVLIDDVLYLVEAKAGAAATIASPALNFDRHARAVQDLIIKAYRQCERFFEHLNSADEVPLSYLIGGSYEECGRVRRSDYRVMVPIGLTIESFSPFSTYCKELPQIVPILGAHAFLSISIDDLFVLERFLPTPGLFAHYMEVRQAVAGIRRAHLFDEFDHLGAYLQKNRFDHEIASQLSGGKLNMVVWDGMGDIVDRSFESEDWEGKPFPTQSFPDELLRVLEALDVTRASGWLSAESYIRDLGDEGRGTLAQMLADHRRTLDGHSARYFVLAAEERSLFIWLQRHGHEVERKKVDDKASAAALALKPSAVSGILLEADIDGKYYRAQAIIVKRPEIETSENAHVFADAWRMSQPGRSKKLGSVTTAVKAKKPGRNDPCPCGSGAKFKKCHGR